LKWGGGLSLLSQSAKVRSLTPHAFAASTARIANFCTLLLSFIAADTSHTLPPLKQSRPHRQTPAAECDMWNLNAPPPLSRADKHFSDSRKAGLFSHVQQFSFLWPEFLPIRRRKSSFCPSRYTGGGIVVGDAADTISAPPVKHSTHPTDARYTPQPQADATSTASTS
jgi:hypothetical protein